ncbi:MAG: transglycosylase SLT domain-containing protein [Thiocapsa sp.]|uniref:transglycosylase SLT domain-containing protein n=1 Tax=Thiocapsa sp. TaxID=2024551 RepID=UPI001BD0634E|nr:MAG: transglycosylase SLT domain-containing protein [Thiocapsa sp.]
MTPIPASTAKRRDQYMPLFQSVGQRTGVDSKLSEATAWAESTLKADARSPVGAQGLMQFMPGTAAGFNIDPNDSAEIEEGAAAMYDAACHLLFGKGKVPSNGGDGLLPEDAVISLKASTAVRLARLYGMSHLRFLMKPDGAIIVVPPTNQQGD